jgi:hypothetical protein
MSWVDYVGFLAALTVLATFCMDTILPLRGLAIASNILFIVYGTAGQLYPVLFLHALLLPINISKIVQLVRKNRFDARIAICCARPARTGPSIAFHSLAESVRGMVHAPSDQTTREPGPATLNQRRRWRRSAPA